MVFWFILQILSTFQYALFYVRVFETDNRDRVVLVNNVTALNKLASEIGRDAVKVINDINTNSSEHNITRSSQGPTTS
jgi:hypothetical protein